MLVACKRNTILGLPEELRNFAFGQDEQGLLPLTIGKKYVVSACQRVKGDTFFLIIPDNGELRTHPWWYPMELFEVTDASVPEDWLLEGDDPAYMLDGF